VRTHSEEENDRNGYSKNQSKIPRPINHRTCDFESASAYASQMNPYVRWHTSNLVGPRLFASKEDARVPTAWASRVLRPVLPLDSKLSGVGALLGGWPSDLLFAVRHAARVLLTRVFALESAASVILVGLFMIRSMIEERFCAETPIGGLHEGGALAAG
jgi:hypothetical protein